MDMEQKRARPAAPLRAGLALVLALALLALTGFRFVDLLRGPLDVTQAEALPGEGAYVTLEVSQLLGFYAEGYDAAGETTSLYAAVPGPDGRLMTVQFPPRFFDSAREVRESARAWLAGESAAATKYVVVRGTVGTLPDAAVDKLYAWFAESMGDLVEPGAYETYLSEAVVRVDRLGGMRPEWTAALSILAGLLLLYALFALLAPRARRARGAAAAENGVAGAPPEGSDSAPAAPPEGAGGVPEGPPEGANDAPADTTNAPEGGADAPAGEKAAPEAAAEGGEHDGA